MTFAVTSIDGFAFTCGLDEAGRGPLAGPVSAACVILPSDFPFEILNDSKKLSEKKREEAEKIICQKALWGHAFVDHKKIDEINILQASLLAMRNAYSDMIGKFSAWARSQGFSDDQITEKEIYALIDGNKKPGLPCMEEAVVKGDAKFPEVMAASIIAKVRRDKIMLEYDRLYPEYGYAGHKGYPTPAHKEICRKLGPSPIQRLSFKY